MDIALIRKKLIECGYADNPITDETAKRLSSFTGKSAEMLREWLADGTSPSYGPINGVDSEFLVNKLNMKAPALIIAYAMLEAEPQENADYFKHLADNIIGFYPDMK